MKSLRAMAKSTLVYGLGDILLFGISYLMMIPLLTRYLTPAEYGVVATLNTVSVFLVAALQLGLPSAAFRFWYLHTSTDGRKTYLSSIWLVSVVLTALLALAVVVFGRPVWNQFIPNADFDRYASYIVWGACFQVVIAFKSIFLRALDRPRWFITLDILQFVTMLGFVTYEVVVLHNGIIGQVLGVFYTLAIFAGVSTIVVLANCGLRFSMAGIGKSFKFAWPVMVGGLVSLLATRSTLLITQYYLVGAAIGLFALGSQIGSLIQLAAASLEKAWQPFLYSRDPEQARTALRGILDLAAPVYTALALVLALFAPEVVNLLASRQYESAWIIATISSFGALFVALSSIANGGLYYATRSGLSLLVTSASAGANLLFCALMIPRWGIVGAAVATALAGLLSLILMFTANRAVFDTRMRFHRVLGAVCFGVGLCVVTSVAATHLSIPRVGVWLMKGISVLVYIFVFWRLKWYLGIRLADLPHAARRDNVATTGIVETK